VGVYHEVYPEPNKVYPRLRKELNSFLGTWLSISKNQGYSLKKEVAQV
jgi:uncharacterized protein YqiB (DUF1249 family)